MDWINKFLTPQQIDKLAATISRAEAQTSGEIVPVIVRRSSAVGHVSLTLTLSLFVVVLLAALPWLNEIWGTGLMWLLPLVFVFIFALARALSGSKWIQKVFVPEQDELDQVFERAQLEFFLNRVSKTEMRTGILLFVSVMEKKAVVLADKGISDRLPPETWDQLVQTLTQHFKKGQWSEGLEKAILRCGEILGEHFPCQRGEDELPNQLVIKD